MNWNLSRLVSTWSPVAVFGFVLGVLFVFFGSCVFLLSVGDFVTTYWTVHRSHSSSLLRSLNQQTAMFEPINHAT